MNGEMLDLIVAVAGTELHYLSAGIDSKGEMILRTALIAGQCVEIDIPRGGGICIIRNIGITDSGRVRFMRRGIEDMELRQRFEKPITEWVTKHRDS